MLRRLLAPNSSPMTLDGTRTYLVGRERVAVVDPGPDDSRHRAAVAAAVGGAPAVVLLTHSHPDHAAGAARLATMLRCAVLSAERGLRDGARIETDAGDLIALRTPGHTPDHVSFHWPATSAVFCGDLMMGGLDTALVAPPEGNLGDYLASLARLLRLEPAVIHPAHGPSFDDPATAIGTYVRHRRDREAQVLRSLEDGPVSPDAIVDAVYGMALHPGLRWAAEGAVHAYLEHLAASRQVHALEDGRWARSGAEQPG